MKEKLYTIPVNDAVNAKDECPFCYLERQIEQDLMDFVLGSGSSYMESDIREQTDAAGFCRSHYKKMYDYGNTLGNGWILKTYYQKLLKELRSEIESYTPGKTSFKQKMLSKSENSNPIQNWVQGKEASCYICNYFKEHYDRYLDTFFYLYTKDEEFRQKILQSKGFCLVHFGDLCAASDTKLNDADRRQFYDETSKLMLQNMERVYEDVAWLIEKFDYRNKDADWKNSKDAIPRGMQKIKGGYPADAVYQQKK